MVDITLIVEIAVFFLFLGYLYRAFSKPLSKALNQRSARIEAAQRDAEENQRRAAEAQVVLQKHLDEARAEAENIIASAGKAAAAQRQALVEQAEGEAAALVQRARAAIERERQVAMDELRREAGRLAVFAASRVIDNALDAETGRDLADRAIADVVDRRR